MASVDELLLVVGIELLAVVVLVAFGAMLGKWIRKRTLANLHPDSRWDGTSKDLVLDYPVQAAKYASLPLVLLGVVQLAVAILETASPEKNKRLGMIIAYVTIAAFF